MKPSLSVIIPTFNRAKALSATIESLGQQSDLDFELIISDDGSRDDTRAIVANFKTPFPIKYIYQTNKGRSAARNHGISQAEGEVILFIDDHVIAHPWLIAQHRQAQNLYRQKKGSWGIVRGNAPLVATAQEGYQAIKEEPITHNADHSQWTLKKNPFRYFFTGNVSVPKASLAQIGGFDERFTEYGYQDSELGYRLLRSGLKTLPYSTARVYVFGVPANLAIRCDKWRQMGHSAVVLWRKNRFLGLYVGVNPFNLLLYLIFSARSGWLLRRFLVSPQHSRGARQKTEYRLRYFAYLLGIWEKLFDSATLKEYYANPDARFSLPPYYAQAVKQLEHANQAF